MPSEDGFKNLKSRKAGKEDSKIKDIKKGREGKHEINPCLRKRQISQGDKKMLLLSKKLFCGLFGFFVFVLVGFLCGFFFSCFLFVLILQRGFPGP